MATDKEKREYAKRLKEISKRFGRFEDATVRTMRDLSVELNRQIGFRVAFELQAGNEPTAAILSNITQDVNVLIDGYNNSLLGLTDSAMTQSGFAGQSFVIDPISALGGPNLPIHPTSAQLNILTDFTSDLITQTTAEMRRQITSQVRMGALSGQSSIETMRSITRIIGINGRKQITGGVTARAERIFRTETNRAFNLASNSQQQSLLEVEPKAMKQWIATGDNRTRDDHLDAHGQTVPIDEPFIVGGEPLDFPLDPAASAEQTVQCRCGSITILPDVEELPTALDQRVADEEQSRLDKLDLTNKADLDKLLGGSSPTDHIRPTGRAPRGLGKEYADRRWIANKIDTQRNFRSDNQFQIDNYRGQKNRRGRISKARIRVTELTKAIDTTMAVADGPGEWAFKRELIDEVFNYVSSITRNA